VCTSVKAEHLTSTLQLTRLRDYEMRVLSYVC
jgi:hypothetical protein